MNRIIFGPAGLGPVKSAVDVLHEYHNLGLKACEIAFTYGAYIKSKKDAEIIRNAAKKLGIKLTIHAHYWINLNSSERQKIKQSKERILECCKIGTWLGAKLVVFHAGYYSKLSKKEAYENIKKEIISLQKTIKEKKYTPKLAPEITGKINVFGDINEISKLVKETNCSFCIDFAHILARYKDYRFEGVKKAFGKYKRWHVHFSGIEYTDKGERRHKKTKKEEWQALLTNLPKNKQITIINESPFPVQDSIEGIKICKKLRKDCNR